MLFAIFILFAFFFCEPLIFYSFRSVWFDGKIAAIRTSVTPIKFALDLDCLPFQKLSLVAILN